MVDKAIESRLTEAIRANISAKHLGFIIGKSIMDTIKAIMGMVHKVETCIDHGRY